MDEATFCRIQRRDVVVILLVIALAFVYRAAIIWDRAAAPGNAGGFDPLPAGSDQLTYYRSIAAYHAGTYPPATFHYQPGISYFLIGLTNVIGTTNLAVLRLVLAALAAVNCGQLYVVTQLGFGNRRISLIAALLLAVYPVSAFYDTDLVITSQAVILLTIALFAALWMYRSPNRWLGAILLGFVIGFGAITRLEVAAAAVLLTAWLFVIRLRKHSLVPFALTALVAAAFIVPVALHNRQGGAGFLITPVGSAEIYRGFNRDANGTYFVSRADFTTRLDYYHYLVLDAQLEPLRFIELVLRKLGLFFSATEPGNNLNYTLTGEAVSLLLRLNPLDFRILVVLAAFGSVPLWKNNRRTLLAFLAVCAGMMGMTMFIWIEARIRTPIVAAMIPLAAYGLYDMAIHARSMVFWRKRLPLVAALVIGVGLAWLAENGLPRKVTVAALPANAQPVDALYNDELRLVGYRIEDSYSPPGVVQLFHPYVVSLYWMLEQPTATDYSFSLKLVVKDAVLDQYDHPVGYTGYPEQATSAWEARRIYVEHIGMNVNTFSTPTEISGHLWMEVYPERDTTRLFDPVGMGARPLELARPAVIFGKGGFETLPADEPQQTAIHFGDLLALEAWHLPASGRGGDAAIVTLGWHTTGTQINDSYVIGVYFQNEAGEYIANFDAPPREGALLTSSLPIHYLLEDRRSVIFPEQPGMYRVFVAVYRQRDGERLPLNGTAETLALIGTVQVVAQL